MTTASAKKVPAPEPHEFKIKHPYVAADLHAHVIGETIRFSVSDRGVYTLVVAELRQVYHNGSETVINVGEGAWREYALAHGTVVEIVDGQVPV